MLLKHVMEGNRMNAPYRKKRRYGKLTLEQKIQIIRAAEKGHSQRTLASQYHCGKTQVHLLITQKDLWLAKWERLGKGEEHLRDITSPYLEVNQMVWDFYKKASSCQIPVTGSLLQERANQVSNSLCYANFIANEDWLHDFLSKFNVKLSYDDNGDGVALLKQFGNNTVENGIFEGYNSSDIFNLGIIDLQYRAVPGGRVGKRECLAVCVCCTATGEKEIQSVVFSENACQESELWNVSVPCFSSPRGEVTVEVYEHTLDVLNNEMAQQQRKILLLVDESIFPSLESEMSNITLQSFAKQPLHEGVVYRFKLLYYQRLLSYLAANCDDWASMDKLAKQLPMWRIMKIVQSAWSQVPSNLIQNCFFECGIPYHRVNCDTKEGNESLLQDIVRLVRLVKSENDSPYSENGTETILEDIFNDQKNYECYLEEREVHSVQEQDAVIPVECNEALPTITRLEALLQMSDVDNSQRQKALQLIDELERVMENIMVSKKSVNHQSDILLQTAD